MSDSHDHGTGSPWPVVFAILAVLLVYAGGLAIGWPQRMTAEVAAHSSGDHHGEEHHDDDHAPHAQVDAHAAGEHDEHAAPAADEDHQAEAAEHPAITPPPIYMVVPFMLLLLAIAVFPLLPGVEHWWESNLHRFYVAAGLGLVTLLYYVAFHEHAIEGHFPAHHVVEPQAGLNWNMGTAVLKNAMLAEFIPFIVLLFSLYTISGGIRVTGDLRAHPLTNTCFIGLGGFLASFIGTTGAAMLLIRPLLETNAERKRVQHTVVFFIFVVCNCGGCLLPIGDPPLFLGYLRGVPFMWTVNLMPQWLLVNGMLLAVYFAWDSLIAYPHETKRDIARDEQQTRRLQITGLGLNGLLLAGVIFSVALLDPSKTIPGTDWHPWMFLREIVQIALVALSLALGSREAREGNRFNYHAILEVAALFSGIFICMQPALQILNVKGPDLGVDSPAEFFWFTGGLSSVLDNAPTYVVFFDTASTLQSSESIARIGAVSGRPGVPEHFLIAISLGAVFMGAMTYIGNGPNFMVKAIAEKSGVKMPSFFGYLRYSGLVLLPLLLITQLACSQFGWLLWPFAWP